MNIKEQRQFVESLYHRARSENKIRLAAVMETLASADVVEANGDPYDYACEIMEREQQARRARGVYVGTEGSLCDGIAWVYNRLRELEEAQKPRKPVWLWHNGAPPKRGVYKVKCDGPNPNAGYRYWDGSRWHAWSRIHAGALSMGKDPTVRKAQIRRPVLYATKAK